MLLQTFHLIIIEQATILVKSYGCHPNLIIRASRIWLRLLQWWRSKGWGTKDMRIFLAENGQTTMISTMDEPIPRHIKMKKTVMKDFYIEYMRKEKERRHVLGLEKMDKSLKRKKEQFDQARRTREEKGKKWNSVESTDEFEEDSESDEGNDNTTPITRKNTSSKATTTTTNNKNNADADEGNGYSDDLTQILLRAEMEEGRRHDDDNDDEEVEIEIGNNRYQVEQKEAEQTQEKINNDDQEVKQQSYRGFGSKTHYDSGAITEEVNTQAEEVVQRLTGSGLPLSLRNRPISTGEKLDSSGHKRATQSSTALTPGVVNLELTIAIVATALAINRESITSADLVNISRNVSYPYLNVLAHPILEKKFQPFPKSSHHSGDVDSPPDSLTALPDAAALAIHDMHESISGRSLNVILSTSPYLKSYFSSRSLPTYELVDDMVAKIATILSLPIPVPLSTRDSMSSESSKVYNTLPGRVMPSILSFPSPATLATTRNIILTLVPVVSEEASLSTLNLVSRGKVLTDERNLVLSSNRSVLSPNFVGESSVIEQFGQLYVSVLNSSLSPKMQKSHSLEITSPVASCIYYVRLFGISLDVVPYIVSSVDIILARRHDTSSHPVQYNLTRYEILSITILCGFLFQSNLINDKSDTLWNRVIGNALRYIKSLEIQSDAVSRGNGLPTLTSCHFNYHSLHCQQLTSGQQMGRTNDEMSVIDTFLQNLDRILPQKSPPILNGINEVLAGQMSKQRSSISIASGTSQSVEKPDDTKSTIFLSVVLRKDQLQSQFLSVFLKVCSIMILAICLFLYKNIINSFYYHFWDTTTSLFYLGDIQVRWGRYQFFNDRFLTYAT